MGAGGLNGTAASNIAMDEKERAGESSIYHMTGVSKCHLEKAVPQVAGLLTSMVA